MTTLRTAPTAPLSENADDDIVAQLDDVTNSVTLDLDGMAGALWAIAFADKNSGLTGGTPVVEALHWMERELTRKADHIRSVSARAAQTIRRRT